MPVTAFGKALAFLEDARFRAAKRVWHPAVCVTAGHYLRFVENRAGHDEYRCRNCGHTFGFKVPLPGNTVWHRERRGAWIARREEGA